MIARDLKFTSLGKYAPWYDKMQVRFSSCLRSFITRHTTVVRENECFRPLSNLIRNLRMSIHTFLTTSATLVNQVGGWTQSFGTSRKGKNATHLMFATVRGAAHEVPYTSPSQAFTLFKAFLEGSSLPKVPFKN